MAGSIQRSHPVPQSALHQSRLGEIVRSPWPAAVLCAVNAASLPIAAGPRSGLLPFTWRLAATVGFASSSYMSASDWYLGAHTTMAGLLSLWSWTKAAKMPSGSTLLARASPIGMGALSGAIAFVSARATWFPADSGGLI